jgi:hypothetical protein
MPIILHRWDILINTTINPYSASLKSISEEKIELIISESDLEKDNVKRILVEEVLDRHKIWDKQQYVQINQAILIRLLDKLHSYKHNQGVGKKLCCMYNRISHHMEEVLKYIQELFHNYFNWEEKVPAPYLVLSIEDLFNQLKQLQRMLERNSAVDPMLTNILISNFNIFCSIQSIAPTYTELLYQTDLMNGLLSDKVLQHENSIKELLIYYNYNNDAFVAYLFDKLRALTETFCSNKEKVSALLYEQKIIKQSIFKLNCYLSPNMPSLKEQVSNTSRIIIFTTIKDRN